MGEGILTVQHLVGKRWTVGTALTGPYFRLVVAPNETLDLVHEGNTVYVQVRRKDGE